MVAQEDRGFASMDRGKQKEIASKGGMASHRRKQEGGSDSADSMMGGTSPGHEPLSRPEPMEWMTGRSSEDDMR